MSEDMQTKTERILAMIDELLPEKLDFDLDFLMPLLGDLKEEMDFNITEFTPCLYKNLHFDRGAIAAFIETHTNK